MRLLKALALILVIPVLLSACATFQGETTFGHYSEAEKYYAKGDFTKAIVEYEAYLQQEPEGNMAIIAHYYIARSQAGLGDIEAAKVGFQSVIKEYPQSDWANFSQDRLDELAAQKT